jgi:predicted nucleotidyltransferase
MGEFTKILKSFSLQDTLNPKIWENPDDVENSKMKSKVRDALMKIAEKFIDYLGDDVFVEDITLTGSLANFNWSEYSDFDLHILVDFQQYEKESKLYQQLFDAKKFIFNENHNIKIFGYDVELYAQDVEEEHTSTGLYSVMNNEWLEKPKKESPDINKKLLVQKIDSWIEKIEKGIEEGKDLEKLKSKLKEYRKSGLEKEGELSYENLVFKFLRRSGHIGKLFDAINQETDKELSVERQITE